MEVVALESGYILTSMMPGVDLKWGPNALIRQSEFWPEVNCFDLIQSKHEVAKNFLKDMSLKLLPSWLQILCWFRWSC